MASKVRFGDLFGRGCMKGGWHNMASFMSAFRSCSCSQWPPHVPFLQEGLAETSTGCIRPNRPSSSFLLPPPPLGNWASQGCYAPLDKGFGGGQRWRLSPAPLDCCQSRSISITKREATSLPATIVSHLSSYPKRRLVLGRGGL